MLTPPHPDNEEARQQSLDRMLLLSTPAEAQFDRVTRTAQRLFGTPMTSFTLVDGDRQWFKSPVGLDVRETGRDISFCGHVVASGHTMIVPNALDDPRFADNPLVTGDPNIRFYAGRPIHNSEGHCIGTLCIIDRTPRAFSEADRQSLDDLGAWLEAMLLNRDLGEAQSELIRELEATRREMLIDPLLWIWNRRGVEDLMQREIKRAARSREPVTVVAIDLDHFKGINDRFGHPAGDAVLKEATSRLREQLRPYDILGRWGGDELIVIAPGVPRGDLEEFGAKLCRSVVARGPLSFGALEIPFSITAGLAQAPVDTGTDFAARLLKAADQALYAAKENGRGTAAVWSGVT
ncbi:sensor domain-containing diguanylate cyclase [Iodidimonas sp. SYSU 1G8]|uniref:sensor domain-containing diguanylate cyclase n=1 Tax=Iodidimonas sp. SYSU 1G8 TaxID=3133967 RepID=UPI0031FF1535